MQSLYPTKLRKDYNLDKEKIYEIHYSDKFKEWIKFAFKKADISSIEYLKDDKNIEKAAQIAYKKIPRFPYRTIIKTTIGEKEFSNLFLMFWIKFLGRSLWIFLF